MCENILMQELISFLSFDKLEITIVRTIEAG